MSFQKSKQHLFYTGKQTYVRIDELIESNSVISAEQGGCNHSNKCTSDLDLCSDLSFYILSLYAACGTDMRVTAQRVSSALRNKNSPAVSFL